MSSAALISPDDLYRACNLFESLRVPVQLRKYDSGVVVVQSETHSDEAMWERLLQWITAHGPQGVHAIASGMHLSINVARELLLVRDDGPQ